MNITILTREVTDECWQWCSEQHFIHQSNIEIYDLTFIVLAVIALIIHGATEDEKAYEASHFFALLMLIFYIIYMLFLK